jgi:hypothetical protein
VTEVHLIEERRFDPPRPVEIEHDGRWWAGTQTAWRLCDDARGWMADVTWTEQHDWAPGSTSRWCGPSGFAYLSSRKRRIRLLCLQPSAATHARQLTLARALVG